MREFQIERVQRIERSLEEVFYFFGDPANLERLTPPWLNFRVLGCSTETIEEGSLIDYQLRLHGIRIRWRSLISSWEPAQRFVDEQVRGPYRSWHHTHTFIESEGDTIIGDRMPLWPLGECALPLAKLQLKRIFGYRKQAIRSLLLA